MIEFVFFSLVTITVLLTCIWSGVICWGQWLRRQKKLLKYQRDVLYELSQQGNCCYSLEEKGTEEHVRVFREVEKELNGNS